MKSKGIFLGVLIGLLFSLSVYADVVIDKKHTKWNKQQDKSINKNTKNIKKVDKKHTKWNKQQDININQNNRDIINNSNSINNNARRIGELDNRIGELEETQYVVEGQVRIYDSKKWQVNPFARYNIGRNRIDTVGVRFTYKFGRSFEEKLIEEQNKRLKILEKQLEIRKQPKVVGKTKKGFSIIANPNGIVGIDKRF